MESPKKIYLTEGDEYSGQVETTWGEERITDEDVEYVRADSYAEREWISVEDRLPERKQSVWVFVRGSGQTTGWWHYYGKKVTWWTPARITCAVTHWMPLPKPPKEETKCTTE